MISWLAGGLGGCETAVSSNEASWPPHAPFFIPTASSLSRVSMFEGQHSLRARRPVGLSCRRVRVYTHAAPVQPPSVHENILYARGCRASIDQCRLNSGHKGSRPAPEEARHRMAHQSIIVASHHDAIWNARSLEDGHGITRPKEAELKKDNSTSGRRGDRCGIYYFAQLQVVLQIVGIKLA